MDNIAGESSPLGKNVNQAVILPRCSICSQVPAEGIKGVMKVGRGWICGKCEQEIVSLQVGSPRYGLILDKIKRVWR